jgi:hypothetical protein
VCHPYPNEKGDTQMLLALAIGIAGVIGIFYTLLQLEGTQDLIEGTDEF